MEGRGSAWRARPEAAGLLWKAGGGSCADWRASQEEVGRNFNWIWFLGAAVWFFDAALGMRHGELARGLADAVIAVIFLILGLFFRRFYKRQEERKIQR